MYLLLALVIVSVVGLMYMFWYVSDMKDQFARQNDTRRAVTEPSHETVATIVPTQAHEQAQTPIDSGRLEEKIVQIVAADDPERERATKSDTGEIVDVYYGNALIRMQVVGKLSGDDADYLAALDKLKQGSNSPASAQPVAVGDAKSVRANASGSDKSVDHFNRINIEDSSGREVNNRLTFAARVQQVVEADDSGSGQTGRQQDKPYIASLNVASVERKNETRIIKVKHGDSLWKIAERAYGTGLKYRQIFIANPHLTAPNKIKVGEFLRVPLQDSPELKSPYVQASQASDFPKSDKNTDTSTLATHDKFDSDLLETQEVPEQAVSRSPQKMVVSEVDSLADLPGESQEPPAVNSTPLDSPTVTNSESADLVAQTAEAASNAQIEKFLLLGKQAVAKDRLRIPKQRSGWHYYKQVLKLDPGNQEAQRGLEKIANRYGDLAISRMEKQQYEKAQMYINRGLGVVARYGRLLALQGEIQIQQEALQAMY